MPPEARDDLSSLAILAHRTFGFCLDGDFNDDGRRDRAAVGVYQTHGAEQGRFLLILAESKPGHWDKSLLHAVPGDPGFSMLSLERGRALGWWSCMECDNWVEVVWAGTGYLVRPHPGGYEGQRTVLPTDPSYFATGSLTWNSVRPGMDSTPISPSCRCNSRRTMSRPSPVPLPTPFVVKNGSKMRP